MRNWLIIISLALGLIVGAGIMYVVLQDSEPTPTSEQRGNSEENQSDDSRDSNSVEFASQYRGTGDRNSYADKPGEPVVFTISSRSELDQRWAEMFVGGLAPPKPAINFENQLVIVAMSEQKPSGGYQVTIKSITNDDGEVIVALEDKIPGNACFNTQALTRPVHIVTTGKLDVDTIKVETVETSGTPCAVPLN